MTYLQLLEKIHNKTLSEELEAFETHVDNSSEHDAIGYTFRIAGEPDTDYEVSLTRHLKQ